MIKKKFTGPFTLKAMDNENLGEFSGYGAVFGNVDAYGDIIVRGAFEKSLKMMKPQECKMLWQHHSDEPIGVYDDMYEDENGLFVKGRLLVNDIPKARECYALLKAGAISGLSIGFNVNPGGSRLGADGNNYLTDLKLWEISVVTFPANPQANVDNVKTMSIKDFEKFLRDSGFSRKRATEIASKGFRSLRDAEDDENSELIKALDNLNNSIKEF